MDQPPQVYSPLCETELNEVQAITAAYCPLVDAETLLRLSDVICFPLAHSVLIQVRTSETPNRPEEDH